MGCPGWMNSTARTSVRTRAAPNSMRPVNTAKPASRPSRCRAGHRHHAATSSGGSESAVTTTFRAHNQGNKNVRPKTLKTPAAPMRPKSATIGRSEKPRVTKPAVVVSAATALGRMTSRKANAAAVRGGYSFPARCSAAA